MFRRTYVLKIVTADIQIANVGYLKKIQLLLFLLIWMARHAT
jgi:hypothetical protein